MSSAEIGIIGGSGLYQMRDLQEQERIHLSTPFGDPSDTYRIGTLGGRRVAFLPRHGQGHTIPPSEVNFRANIYGFRSLGVDWLISVSAVGSMRENIAPLHIVLPDQFIDRTRSRPGSFFGEGIVAHVAFSEPICPKLRRVLASACHALELVVHPRGTYLCIEGPQFSTKAESLLYRQWEVDVIGMTNLPEAKLAREAELCYATLALVTDYDCWRKEEKAVSVSSVLDNLRENTETAKRLIHAVVESLPEERHCACQSALEAAIITNPSDISLDVRDRLGLLLGKYMD